MGDIFGEAATSRRRRSSVGRRSGAPGAGGGGGGGGQDVRNNVFRIPSNINIKLGLQWGFIGDDPVDLDASCVAFGEGGECIEAVFFNHLNAGYMEHTGDNTTGEDMGEDDESIIFYMNKIPPTVHYLMVCVTSYTGAKFLLVNAAHVRIVNLATKEAVGQFSLAVVGHHTATLLCAFSRVAPSHSAPAADGLTWWDMREINIACGGFTFCDVIPRMLGLLGVPPPEFASRLETLPNYPLEKKDETLDMLLSQLKFGVGWDGENDLDASLIMVDKEGRYVDHVHAKYGKLRSNAALEPKGIVAETEALKLAEGGSGTFQFSGVKSSVVHSGDKLNGFDVEGDDEYIEVDLMNVAPQTKYIFFACLLFEGFAKTLPEVPRGYARMLNKNSPGEHGMHKEIDRLQLRDVTDDCTALIAYVVVKKDDAHWEMTKVGQGLGGRDWVDIFPFVRSFSKLGAHVDDWLTWRTDIFPFCIEVEFLGVRNLTPAEPHHFACHCLAWVCDKMDRGRFRSTTVRDRHNVNWTNEKHSFIVDKMDVLRVMVFEVATVGHADIPMADFFKTILPPVYRGESSSSSAFVAFPSSPSSAATGTAPPRRLDLSVDTTVSSSTPEPSSVPPPAAASAAAADAPSPSSPTAAEIMMETVSHLPSEGHQMFDAWLPLEGTDVGGEIHLRMKRIAMPSSIFDEDHSGRGTGSWCVMA